MEDEKYRAKKKDIEVFRSDIPGTGSLSSWQQYSQDIRFHENIKQKYQR